MALQCDLTRYVTFMMGNGGSNQSFSFIGVRGAHHEISHHQNTEENLEKLTQIGIWEMEQFADLLRRMKDVLSTSTIALSC